MPLAPPFIDNRRYQDLLNEVLARVPVHTPEWTNFNNSDPGVTLVQLFAFLAENVLYRANLIPDRNRVKFLQLLGVPLAPAAEARGLVTINNDRGALLTEALPADLEVRAGSVSFRTQLGLDVLPIEARAFFKRPLVPVPVDLVAYYQLLYASYQTTMPVNPSLYETVAFDPGVIGQIDINDDTVDRSVWIALLVRKNDPRGPNPADPWKPVRDQLAGRILTLGLVPALDAVQTRLTPGGQAQPNDLLVFEIPRIGSDGKVPVDANGAPAPTYQQLEPHTDVDVLTTPGVVQLALPASESIGTWSNLHPLESGVGDLPPALDDSALPDRLITWLRVRATAAARARVLWLGINAAPVIQRERVIAEPLANGDGSPDQTRRLSRAPVLNGSIEIVTQTGTEERRWSAIDDLMAAPPEVPGPDPRHPLEYASRYARPRARLSFKEPASRTPGAWPPPVDPNVFAADYEAGVLTFGDGLRGRRLPLGASVFASYEFCQGAAGNVAANAIKSAPALPSGYTVANPVRTWGGADAETADEGTKQISRFLQHRDRLVSTDDFESIAWRAPGVDVGRVDVLPAFHPDLIPAEPGAAPGVVTLMAIPRTDPGRPDYPRADRLFLNNLCRYLDPRRLVTTELIIRGPVYKPLWISAGVDVAAGFSVAETVDAVKQRLRQFLAPISPEALQGGFAAQSGLLFGPVPNAALRGWPLRTAVSARVLLAEAARVAGVVSVAGLLLAQGTNTPTDIIDMTGLELPQVLGISVVAGDPLPIAALRGDAAAGGGIPPATAPPILPVPVIPETCK